MCTMAPALSSLLELRTSYGQTSCRFASSMVTRRQRFANSVHFRSRDISSRRRNLRIVAESASSDPPAVQVKTEEGTVKINGQALPSAAVTDTGNDAPETKFASSPDGYHGWNKPNTSPFLSITVLGATGDLARNKIFPALFALYYSGNLYKNVAIFGFSRSELSDDEFRDLISESATCRVDGDQYVS